MGINENGFKSTDTYIASEELMSAVNVARALKKPLLIKGEPGTGKTMLAKAVATSMGMNLITWNIKSTTKAQDGLYMYDTIQRLYDGQFGEEGVDDIAHYIKLGKLGEAFVSEEQVVLLIDEIEKYPPDDELQKTLYVSRLKERFNDCLIQLNNIKNTQIDYLKESGE